MRWLLPEGVDELLPPDAWALEELRRKLLDLMRGAGFELILPPLIEHLDALRSGVGSELEMQTFRLTDQLSGRQLGLRADITPQAARIDARHFADQPESRLCYLGTVVRTRPDTIGGARCLRQLGAEIFGVDSVAADLEIIELMLSVIDACGIGAVHLDIGHTGVYRAIAQRGGLDGADEQEVFRLLQNKATDDLGRWISSSGLDSAVGRGLLELPDLYGGAEVLDRADSALGELGDDTRQALQRTRELHDRLARARPATEIHVDLAELRGYRYHTGVVFSAFVAGRGRELSRGGRYDGAGADFGVSRAATGFSADLDALMRAGEGAV